MEQLRKILVGAAVAVAAAALAGHAAAGSKLFVGFAEDTPKWEGDAAVAPVRAIGAAALRITVPWRSGETAVSGETADGLDQAVTAAYGLRVVLAVYGAAADAPVTAARRGAYCSFVRNLLERYPTVNDVVIWNEPNSSRFWSPQFRSDGTSAAPAAYGQLLTRCWDVLHEHRSEVNLLAPATSAHGFDEHGAPRKSHSPVNFILRLGEAYRGSGRDLPLFDTVAHHAYGLTSAERPWKQHEGQVVGEGDWVKLVEALRIAFGGTAQRAPGECVAYDCLGIWYTEIGYQVTLPAERASYYHGTENGRTLPAATGEDRSEAVDEDSPAPDQATQIVDAVRLAHCQPYVEGFFNFLLRDEPDLRGWQSGVQWADGGWKPSLPAFRQAIREAHEGTVVCAGLKGGPVEGAETTPPGTPTGLTATGGAGRVSLQWTRGSERDLAGYHVYRADSEAGPYTRLSDLVKARRYVDRTAGPSQQLYFVAAVDSAGNESAFSRPAVSRR